MGTPFATKCYLVKTFNREQQQLSLCRRL